MEEEVGAASEDLPPDGIPADVNDDDDDDDDEKIVERDPTGRYGRYETVLGKGAVKTVYKAFDEVDGIEVAWNQVKVQEVFQCQEDLERLFSEVRLLKTLKHKNIIKFYNSWVDIKSKNVNFITEIFTSGTLRQYRKKHKHCDMKAVKNWSRQILRGLLYLHSHDPPIIHRDLKCDNIFVNGNQGEVKIGDLGLAAILKHKNAAHSVIGTPEFMAPELYEEEYNELVDIYAFGMCVLEMVTLEYPYSECKNAAQIYKKVVSGKKPAALDKVKDPEVRAFVEKCLATASRRLPARELLMDPFLNDGDRGGLGNLDMSHLSRSMSKGSDLSSVGSRGQESYRSKSSPEKPVLQTETHSTQSGNVENEVSEQQLKSTSRSSDSDLDGLHEADRLRCSRDFKVKGKLVDDDDHTVFLRLRIVDSEGLVRNIHFPFNMEEDTAFSVASEMVEELALSDQDVTSIAEMIDAEIMKLVPDWKPGPSFDETEGSEGTSSEVGDADDQEEQEAEGEEAVGHLSTVSSANSLPGRSSDRSRSASPSRSRSRSQSCQRNWPSATSPSASTKLFSGSPANGGLDHVGVTHGRFWEGLPGTVADGGAGFSSDESDEGAQHRGSGTLSDSEDRGHVEEEEAIVVAAGDAPVKRFAADDIGLPLASDGSSEIRRDSASSGRKSLTDFSAVMELKRHSEASGGWDSMLHSQSVAELPRGGPSPWSSSGELERGDGDDDLMREEEELRLEREHEMQELEMRYWQRLLAVRNRHRRGKIDSFSGPMPGSSSNELNRNPFPHREHERFPGPGGRFNGLEPGVPYSSRSQPLLYHGDARAGFRRGGDERGEPEYYAKEKSGSGNYAKGDWDPHGGSKDPRDRHHSSRPDWERVPPHHSSSGHAVERDQRWGGGRDGPGRDAGHDGRGRGWERDLDGDREQGRTEPTRQHMYPSRDSSRSPPAKWGELVQDPNAPPWWLTQQRAGMLPAHLYANGGDGEYYGVAPHRFDYGPGKKWDPRDWSREEAFRRAEPWRFQPRDVEPGEDPWAKHNRREQYDGGRYDKVERDRRGDIEEDGSGHGGRAYQRLVAGQRDEEAYWQARKDPRDFDPKFDRGSGSKGDTGGTRKGGVDRERSDYQEEAAGFRRREVGGVGEPMLQERRGADGKGDQHVSDMSRRDVEGDPSRALRKHLQEQSSGEVSKGGERGGRFSSAVANLATETSASWSPSRSHQLSPQSHEQEGLGGLDLRKASSERVVTNFSSTGREHASKSDAAPPSTKFVALQREESKEFDSDGHLRMAGKSGELGVQAGRRDSDGDSQGRLQHSNSGQKIAASNRGEGAHLGPALHPREVPDSVVPSDAHTHGQQMKKEQLQKSIAELEAKTLQGLVNNKTQKNGFAPSSSSNPLAMKKPSISTRPPQS